MNEFYECGEGWYPLIHKAIAIVQRYNGINRPNPYYGPVDFVQIKEKFGCLCLYLNYYPNDHIWKQMKDIEDESTSICEYCGTTENVKTRGIHKWTYTLCDNCAEKETKRYESLFK